MKKEQILQVCSKQSVIKITWSNLDTLQLSDKKRSHA